MTRWLFGVAVILAAVTDGRAQAPPCTSVPLNTTSSGRLVIVTAPASGQLEVCGGYYNVSSTMTVTTSWIALTMNATAGRDIPLPTGLVPVGGDIALTKSSSGRIIGWVSYRIVNAPAPPQPQPPGPVESLAVTLTPSSIGVGGTAQASFIARDAAGVVVTYGRGWWADGREGDLRLDRQCSGLADGDESDSGSSPAWREGAHYASRRDVSRLLGHADGRAEHDVCEGLLPARRRR
jgi:hypothetical protein